MPTKDWLNLFENNKNRVLKLEKEDYRITREERRKIAASIRIFQLGESAEGRTLRAQAKAYVREGGPEDYPAAIACLIREENRHSAYLARFMRDQEIPLAEEEWTDGVFRFLRKFAGMELAARVLVTGEIVAITYYACLGGATRSKNLKKICARLWEEEIVHVQFQMQHIREMNERKSKWLATLSDAAHSGLVAATIPVVWWEHRPVLCESYGFSGFFQKVWSDYREFHRIASPHADTGRYAPVNPRTSDPATASLQNESPNKPPAIEKSSKDGALLRSLRLNPARRTWRSRGASRFLA